MGLLGGDECGRGFWDGILPYPDFIVFTPSESTVPPVSPSSEIACRESRLTRPNLNYGATATTSVQRNITG
jgi:hypothetical protein